MKKISLLISVCVILMASISFAQAPIFSKTPVIQPKGLATIGGALGDSLPFQLNGDSMYIVRSNTFAGGIGIDLASWKGLLTLRGEMAQGIEGSPFLGAGVFLNIPTLFNMITGASWQAGAINPSIGVVPGYSFTNKNFDAAIVLSVISVTF